VRRFFAIHNYPHELFTLPAITQHFTYKLKEIKIGAYVFSGNVRTLADTYTHTHAYTYAYTVSLFLYLTHIGQHKSALLVSVTGLVLLLTAGTTLSLLGVVSSILVLTHALLHQV
jgi:hypothetical protein